MKKNHMRMPVKVNCYRKIKAGAEAEVKAVGTEEVFMAVHPVIPAEVVDKAGAEAEVKAVETEEVFMAVHPVIPAVVVDKVGAEVGSLLEKRLSGICVYPVRDP